MIRSMTGFASVSREDDSGRVSVTLKSVNHRFLDIALKAPGALAAIEPQVRSVVQQRVTRGRVEITMSVESTTVTPREVRLDHGLLEGVARAIEEARTRGLVSGELTVSDALRLPQLLDVRAKTDADAWPAALTQLVDATMRAAVEALVVMRDTEGRFLAKDLELRLATIETLVNDLEQQSREGQTALESRLRERLAGLPADVSGDPALVAQEVVRFVARSDVDEELVRLRGHLEHWRGLAAGPEPCGRKLDFLVQEMNREINTIGSKIEGARVSEAIISAKTELERVREQVQNVE
jgi:uncharacterized protein (TIGR00255 family)